MIKNNTAKRMIYAVLAFIGMASCSPKTVYVTAENTSARSDTLMQTRTERDSRTEKDSVLVYVKGDTVYVRETRWRTVTNLTADTVYVASHDTVEVTKPYPVERTVYAERSRRWWEWALMAIGLAALALRAKKLCRFIREAWAQI